MPSCQSNSMAKSSSDDPRDYAYDPDIGSYRRDDSAIVEKQLSKRNHFLDCGGRSYQSLLRWTSQRNLHILTIQMTSSLTIKQECFAQKYVGTGNAGEAYRQA